MGEDNFLIVNNYKNYFIDFSFFGVCNLKFMVSFLNFLRFTPSQVGAECASRFVESLAQTDRIPAGWNGVRATDRLLASRRRQGLYLYSRRLRARRASACLVIRLLRYVANAFASRDRNLRRQCVVKHYSNNKFIIFILINQIRS